MKWIEIMGLSGVGKSTFLKQLTENKEPNEEWVTLFEGLKHLAMERMEKNKPIERMTMAYFNQRSVNRFKRHIIESYLDRKMAYLEKGKIYDNLLKGYLKYFCETPDLDIIEKVYRISLFKDIISDLCLFDLYEYRRIVIFDEGPLNHYPSAAFDDVKAIPQILPKGVIFCELDQETNFKRIKDREKKRGRPSPIHRNLSDAEIRSDIHKRRNNINEKKNILISLGIPLLVVNLQESETENIINAKEFISNLVK